MWQPLVKANYEAEMGAHPTLEQITTQPRNTEHSEEAKPSLVSTYYLSPGIHLNIGKCLSRPRTPQRQSHVRAREMNHLKKKII